MKVTDTLRERSQSAIAKLSAPRYVFNDTECVFFSPKCVRSLDGFEANRTDKLYDADDCKLNFVDGGSCKEHMSSLWIIDFDKEKRMGFGRGFPEELVPAKGQVGVNQKQFRAFNVKIGDTLLLHIELGVTCSRHIQRQPDKKLR